MTIFATVIALLVLVLLISELVNAKSANPDSAESQNDSPQSYRSDLFLIGYTPAICKFLASVLLIVLLVTQLTQWNDFSRFILIGLIFSFLGDLLLIPKSTNSYFLAGIAAFALTHLSYLLALLQFPLSPIGLGLCSLIFGFCTVLVYRWLSPHLSAKYRLPVLAYLTMILLMLVVVLSACLSGISREIQFNDSGFYWIGLGALLFAISDLFVARHRFIQAALINRIIGLPLYFAAQLMIVYGSLLLSN